MISVWCEDIRNAGFKFQCCSSCHEDANEGYIDLSEDEAPRMDGRRWRSRDSDRWYARICCGVMNGETRPTTRDDWAKVLKAYRKMRTLVT